MPTVDTKASIHGHWSKQQFYPSKSIVIGKEGTSISLEPWIATTATVTTCKFQFAGLSSLAFGVNLRDKYRITFDYYAHGRLYSDDFQSPTAIPQNAQIPISYNPLDPFENSRTHRAFAPSGPVRKPPLVLIGIAGSIVLALAWLAILRGCI